MLNHQKAPQCPFCTKRLSYIRQRKTETRTHTQRMKRICQKVIRVSEKQFTATDKHRHDYEIAKNKLAEM